MLNPLELYWMDGYMYVETYQLMQKNSTHITKMKQLTGHTPQTKI